MKIGQVFHLAGQVLGRFFSATCPQQSREKIDTYKQLGRLGRKKIGVEGFCVKTNKMGLFSWAGWAGSVKTKTCPRLLKTCLLAQNSANNEVNDEN